jgi:dGTPase
LIPLPSAPRAAYASDWRRTRGRLYPEASSPTRSDFQRDRDRIIHSTAFRRLAHKTQVFVPHEGDHYRTRLTHTIEVGQIARALARSLRLDDDLAEALALAHDLGHTCFGHTGEDALDACMRPWGGFDHNAQALRIVTKLEHRYADFDGLNLVWETLEGLVKHNGPLLQRDGSPIPRYAARGLPLAILEYDARQSLELASFASAEAQAAAIADDIAYNAHDIDDGLRAGVLDLEGLRAVPFLATLLDEIAVQHPGLERARTLHELGRRVITRFVEDVIVESQKRLDASGVTSAAEVRAMDHPLVAFSPAMAEADRAIKSYLFPHMDRHPRVMRIRDDASRVVTVLFERFLGHPADMPGEWAAAVAAVEGTDAAPRRARIVCDYIAGMTDRYALAEHRRLFGTAPDLTAAFGPHGLGE